MSTKGIPHVEIKNADRGQVEAVFARFDVVDHDGDVTLPGAFTDGAEAPISAYGHKSWEGALPVGKGRIRTTRSEAIVEGQFFMNTTGGQDTFEIVKQLGPLGQWSYGYEAHNAYSGEKNGRKVRFLPRQIVREFSPVLIGAGIETRTLSAKSRDTERPPMTGLQAIRPHETDVVNRPWHETKAAPESLSVSDMRSMAACVDTTADPETKGAYRHWHHESPHGPANVRACVKGIAELNSDSSLPEPDRQAVYDHLAAHLRDADREPPELRPAGGAKNLRDEVATALAGVGAAIESASRVVALRAQKGKTLSKVNAEYLDWLDEDLMALHRKLRSYIDSPDDDAVREYLRFVQTTTGGLRP